MTRRERLDQLVSEISARDVKALAVAGDASVQTDIDSLLEQALAWKAGGAKDDIVVVNAGRGLAGGMLDSEESKWQEVFQINVLGAAYLMRRAGAYMAERNRGDIVVVGSVVGKHISPFSGFYGSSKFAVGAMAEGLRREGCRNGVRVSLILPGIVVGEFQEVAGYDEENFGKGVAPFGKLLEPRAIADGIHWLLTLPPHVNVHEMAIRPTGRNYP